MLVLSQQELESRCCFAKKSFSEAASAKSPAGSSRADGAYGNLLGSNLLILFLGTPWKVLVFFDSCIVIAFNPRSFCIK